VNCLPLAIFQVLPLIRTVVTNPEAGLEDIAVVAAGLPGHAEPLPSGRSHFLSVKPLVVRDRRVVGVGTDAKQGNAESQDATERFHGSLHYGLSLVSASANHTKLSGNQSGHNNAKMESYFRPAGSFFDAPVVFLYGASATLTLPPCLFVRVAHDDRQCVLGQRPLQRFGFLPGRAHLNVTLFIGLENDRHRLGMDRLDDRRRAPADHVQLATFAFGVADQGAGQSGKTPGMRARLRFTLRKRRLIASWLVVIE
jgi:hypothetical protein